MLNPAHIGAWKTGRSRSRRCRIYRSYVECNGYLFTTYFRLHNEPHGTWYLVDGIRTVASGGASSLDSATTYATRAADLYAEKT